MTLCDRCESRKSVQKVSFRVGEESSGKALIQEDYDLCGNCLNWAKSKIFEMLEWTKVSKAPGS